MNLDPRFLSTAIEAVVLAGTISSGLAPETQALIASHVTTPLDLQVFVTPT